MVQFEYQGFQACELVPANACGAADNWDAILRLAKARDHGPVWKHHCACHVDQGAGLAWAELVTDSQRITATGTGDDPPSTSPDIDHRGGCEKVFSPYLNSS